MGAEMNVPASGGEQSLPPRDPRFMIGLFRSDSTPPHWRAAVRVRLGEWDILADFEDASGGRLVCDIQAESAFFCDGEPVSDDAARGGSDPVPLVLPETVVPGLYNLILFDGRQGTVSIVNDTCGSLPCYYVWQAGGLVLSNSLYLLRRRLSLGIDPQGFGEQYALCWTVGDTTVLEGVTRVPPGSATVLEVASRECRSRRISHAWTSIEITDTRAALRAVEGAWVEAINRIARNATGPIGLLLSGGLDSRIVLAELVRQGVEPICATHGDGESTEFAIAQTVARSFGVPFISSPLDASFSFHDLGLDTLLPRLDLLFNPMWLRTSSRLHAAGARSFVTGGLGELLSGAFYRGSSHRRRAYNNLLLAAGVRPRTVGTTTAAAAESTAAQSCFVATKRLRNYRHLLQPGLQEFCRSASAGIRERVERHVAGYDSGRGTSGEQLMERFAVEHDARKYVSTQELSLRLHGPLAVPALDPGFLRVVTSIHPGVRYDHHLYYKFVRQRYPEAARLPVPNLFGGVNAPQFLIEARRIVGKAVTARRGHGRRYWTNFDAWIRSTGALVHYEREFLQYEDVFDPDAIRVFFHDVADGRKRLYDGNETLNFLSLAKLLSVA
jgi:hypothetical protein